MQIGRKRYLDMPRTSVMVASILASALLASACNSNGPTGASASSNTAQVPDASDATWPIVEVDATSIRLDGHTVGDTQAVEHVGKTHKIDDLFASLRDTRTAWKTAHASAPFPGVVGLHVPADASLVVVKSALETAVFAGYPRVSLQVGNADAIFDLVGDARLPSSNDPPVAVLHLELLD